MCNYYVEKSAKWQNVGNQREKVSEEIDAMKRIVRQNHKTQNAKRIRLSEKQMQILWHPTQTKKMSNVWHELYRMQQSK